MSVIRNSIHALLGMMLIAVASSANAALVNYTITGDVIFAGTNSFGLNDNDIITATGTIDTSSLASQLSSGSLLGGDAVGTIYFDASSGNTMTINVGNTVFDASHDGSFADGGYPYLAFGIPGDGVLHDFNIFAEMGINGAPEDFSSFNLGFNDSTHAISDPYTIYGEWRPTVAFSSASPVPVPAAVWLFGSGLLGLMGFARRK